MPLHLPSLQTVSIAVFYAVVSVMIGMVLIAVALVTASYINVEFPTGDTGDYGFLMKAVQPRVPLARVGGSAVSQPFYNPQYTTFGISPGAPISPAEFYATSKPFSTCAWWSRLVSQKSPTAYTPNMPYVYCGTFNLYRSVAVPSFAITIARPYALGGANITATKVCGQETTGTQIHTRAFNISDVAPTCFTAPILWSVAQNRPYIIGTEMSYSAAEGRGNMTTELLYSTPLTGESLNITLSQMVPYVVYTLSPGSSVSLNSLYRDANPTGAYVTIKLVNPMAVGPLPITIPGATLMTFTTEIVAQLFPPAPQQIGLSQTSIVTFQVAISPPATVTQLANFTVIVTADGSPILPTRLVLQPSKYAIAHPHDATKPTTWIHLDTLVSATMLGATPVTALRGFVSATSRNGHGVITYASDSGQPLFFVPSLSMLNVGKMSGASPVETLAVPNGVNHWLSPQGVTSVYVAPSGRFDVAYPLFEPPAFGAFDIYSAFDANSLKRLSFIFNRDLEALYAIDISNDPFYVSVRKLFTFAQMTYAVFHYPAAVLVNVLLPPLRKHLLESLDALIQSDRNELKLGYNQQLFTVATADPQYGSSQNQMFGDNHVGQYGMLLFTYYIAVSIQFDNSARRAIRDRYQTVMVDLMRDFAQPYVNDPYIPSMRHFDYGVGISWQTSSIIEASSLQVSEVINGYYASWLVASLFGDNKLRDYYRAILSIEMATHQEYRLASLTPQASSTSNVAAIYRMIQAANALYTNCTLTEFGTGPPGGYATLGTIVYLVQGGEIVLHGVRNNHPDYGYLLDNIKPNTVADFSTATFYRPMTPLTMSIIPLSMGINLNAFETVVFTATQGIIGLGALVQGTTHRPEVFAYDVNTGLPAQVLTLESSPAPFMTIQAAYSLSSYAVNYVTNFTWAGASLPPETCAIIPSGDLPSYLAPVVQYNRLGVLDSNTVLWIQFVITSFNGNR